MATAIEIRATALEATIAEWRDKSFNLGKVDCFKMHIANLRRMGISIPGTSKCIGYKSPLQARATLRRVWKVSSVIEWCDKFHTRIAPAQALVGDVLAMPGHEEGTLGAIGIYMGNDLVFAFVEGYDTPQAGRLTYDEGAEPIAAWRTLR